MIKFPLDTLCYWASYGGMEVTTIATTRDKPFYLMAYKSSIYSYIYLIDLIALKMVGPVYEKGDIVHLHFKGRGSFGGTKLFDDKEEVFSSSLDEFSLHLEMYCDKENSLGECSYKYTYDELLGVLINKLYLFDCLDNVYPYYFIGISKELSAIKKLRVNITRDIDKLLKLHYKKFAYKHSYDKAE